MFTALAAPAAQDVSHVDVIVQADGTTDAVSQQIRSIGGQVRIQYRNVPAVAARVPSAKLGTLAALAGVAKVERDRLVYLQDPTPHTPARPAVYAVSPSLHRQVVPLAAADLGKAPGGYANFLYTGATEIWDETSLGAGSVVAVVDSGVARNVALSHAVIGAPGFPNGYNAFPDGAEATDPNNYWHGTFVAGVIASSAGLLLDDPTDALYMAIAAHLPGLLPEDPSMPLFVPIFGQAPLAQIYPVKVFPQDGGGTPTSFILDGLDHVLSLKKDGLLDIDVVNMSLGGSTLWDGLDVFDRFVSELTKANILTVASTGNEGPTPNSVGSPGTSRAVLAVGALDYPESSRVFYEWLGLANGIGSGMGLIMRPTDEVRVVNFSSRGPTSDGRIGPELTALGLWNFGVGPQNQLFWAGGTSFASPTVAGVGALLNADWEKPNRDTAPKTLEAALLRSADSRLVGRHWRAPQDQGYGAVNAPEALKTLRQKPEPIESERKETLKPNILREPEPGQTEQWTDRQIKLDPSQTYDAILEIGKHTSKVTIEIYDIQAPDNSAFAFWPNSLEVHVQSAKRSAVPPPVAVLWYPFFYGNSFKIEIEDGPWALAGEPWAYQPMEQGLMKVSLMGDFSNQNEVRCKMRITRENHLKPLKNPVAAGPIAMGELLEFQVNVPAGTASAIFDLQWQRDWSKLPTSDLDMYVLDSNGVFVGGFAGATLNAPERLILENPAPGSYYVLVYGYEIHKPEEFKLFLRTQ